MLWCGAEAAALEAGEDDDPLGLGHIHESDDEYDLAKETAADGDGGTHAERQGLLNLVVYSVR